MIRKARPAARLFVLDPEDHLLMFRFDSPGKPGFWATPGGACDPGETFSAAARREMLEETGWMLDPGPEVAQRTVEFTTLEGENVWSDERYFLVRVPERRIDITGHTALEQAVMQVHRWWPLQELRQSVATIFPEDIANMVEKALVHD